MKKRIQYITDSKLGSFFVSASFILLSGIISSFISAIYIFFSETAKIIGGF